MYVSLAEAAEFENIKYYSMVSKIRRGKQEAEKIYTGVKCGFEYRIPLESLSKSAQTRYFAKHPEVRDEAVLKVDKEPKKKILDADYFNKAQVEEAERIEKIIKEWQMFRFDFPGKKAEADKVFLEKYNVEHEVSISQRWLYDKDKAYREHGVLGLVDCRKNHEKRGRKIDEEAWSMFLAYYLDENRLSVKYVYDCIKKWIAIENLDIEMPSVATFRRASEDIPVSVIKYFRHGEKVFDDRCMLYVKRLYSGIFSNDYWSSDYHTLDMMVRDDVTGKVFRPHLVTWIDVRSRKVLSFRLHENSDSHGAILAFKDAVSKYGLPVNVYLDNGREFLVHDFGGKGRRKANYEGYGETMLERLGIRMVNAIVRNGKAKVIERSFKQVTSEFAKLYITYCGNRPGNRPERHNKIMKKEDNIPLLSEVKEDLKNYIYGYYNKRASEAEGLFEMSADECYAKNLLKKRTLSSQQLDYMLLRSAKLQKVSRQGVFIKIHGITMYYYDSDFVARNMGKLVYVRYDPDKLDSVRIYDEHEKFLTVAERLPEGGYDMEADKDAVIKIAKEKKKLKNFVKAFKEEKTQKIAVKSLKELVMDISRKNAQLEEEFDPIIIPANFELEKVVGAESMQNLINFDTMIKNAKGSKRK